MVTTRLDKALVDRGLAHGRSEAREQIDAGLVLVDGVAAIKPSQLTVSTTDLQVSGSVSPYVSRGGQKLQAALSEFDIDPTGRICLDVGASTGGFTDCLLQRGAAHVTAIDVGHGQMVPHIAADSRVETREGINARHLAPSDFSTLFDLMVVDLSFISLTLVLPALAPLLVAKGDLVCLIKPQFEVGVNGIGKGGIVRSELLRNQALERVIASARDIGLIEHGRMVSPITGGEGNKEFLAWLKPLE